MTYYPTGPFTFLVNPSPITRMKSIKEIRREKLAVVIDEKCEGNQSRAADTLGYSTPSLVNRYVTGAKDIGDRTARKIEETFGYPQFWMDSDIHAPTKGAPASPPDAFKKIPVKGMAQLGDDRSFVSVEYAVGNEDGYVYFPTKDPDAYALRCTGESMRPRVKHNEFVVAEPNAQVQNGDEVLVKSLDGRVMVKELAYIRDGIVHLSSVNDKHGMLRILEVEIKQMHFVGGIVKQSAWHPD
ncbi:MULTISPECIES: S24 family peptidase [unclassified Cupriavidus]|uniref:S24 family peptidase n=1 Tax=unclassified Cupriavidus TaxID=2640874 RepID=UPI001AE93584|nr:MULTISPECIES: S24 family peptidase [unclassified Cupriavidus]MBP0629947.1 helix-turn-helix transcriptional regulator [Cupriavidus sp. AcVe19-1a]MBP0634666.1 helix-turn-helix transcriptional regulator [Cupriavidus sp. AcVe19-6a]